MGTGVARSVRSLAKEWGVTRRTAQYRVNTGGWWSKVDPWEVGSMKTSVNVWKN